MSSIQVIGNPKEGSRTREAAELLAEALTDGPRTTIELAPLGPSLLGWGDESVAAARDAVAAARLVVFASPTFKATYTGLLKLFLEKFDGGTGLAGVTVVPLMLGASERHALAPELTLRPVLTELGAVTLPGLYLLDSTFREDGEIAAYAAKYRPVVDRLSQV
ncbi:NAD(P)H-dependent oxidoreductase [Microbacterium sp. K24]|jgi:FMN reductase|uniref:NADPH-dependent FMN reductase n=1 Tax=Microbacterium sp. K24 TaxID=2305446 RepID=UPI00109CB2A3|nr:NAD(P)H-dependent oxidoreductase [Microbacterium sp. K24]